MNTCPNCGSKNVEIQSYDFGMDPETGYLDKGMWGLCHTCNIRSDACDFEEVSTGRDGKSTDRLFRVTGLVIGLAIVLFTVKYVFELFWSGWR